jgi:sugar phosphate isomerase/epimerase
VSVFASTACLPGRENLPARIARYLDAGIESIELGAGVEVGGTEPATLSTDLTLLVHNYFPPPAEPFVLNLASPDPTIRDLSLDLATRAIDLSAQLGAPFYSVHAGFVGDPVGFDGLSFVFPEVRGALEMAAAEERFTESLRSLLPHADDRRVALLVENNVCTAGLVGKLLYQTAEEFERLFDRVRADQLGMLLDTGHLNVSAKTLGLSRSGFIDRVAPHVRALHLHDNAGTRDEHDPVEEGSWVLRAIDSGGIPPVPVIVESKFDSVESLAKHVEWLQSRLPSVNSVP